MSYSTACLAFMVILFTIEFAQPIDIPKLETIRDLHLYLDSCEDLKDRNISTELKRALRTDFVCALDNVDNLIAFERNFSVELESLPILKKVFHQYLNHVGKKCSMKLIKRLSSIEYNPEVRSARQVFCQFIAGNDIHSDGDDDCLALESLEESFTINYEPMLVEYINKQPLDTDNLRLTMTKLVETCETFHKYYRNSLIPVILMAQNGYGLDPNDLIKMSTKHCSIAEWLHIVKFCGTIYRSKLSIDSDGNSFDLSMSNSSETVPRNKHSGFFTWPDNLRTIQFKFLHCQMKSVSVSQANALSKFLN